MKIFVNIGVKIEKKNYRYCGLKTIIKNDPTAFLIDKGHFSPPCGILPNQGIQAL